MCADQRGDKCNGLMQQRDGRVVRNLKKKIFKNQFSCSLVSEQPLGEDDIKVLEGTG